MNFGRSKLYSAFTAMGKWCWLGLCPPVVLGAGWAGPASCPARHESCAKPSHPDGPRPVLKKPVEGGGMCGDVVARKKVKWVENGFWVTLHFDVRGQGWWSAPWDAAGNGQLTPKVSQVESHPRMQCPFLHCSALPQSNAQEVANRPVFFFYTKLFAFPEYFCYKNGSPIRNLWSFLK